MQFEKLKYPFLRSCSFSSQICVQICSPNNIWGGTPFMFTSFYSYLHSLSAIKFIFFLIEWRYLCWIPNCWEKVSRVSVTLSGILPLFNPTTNRIWHISKKRCIMTLTWWSHDVSSYFQTSRLNYFKRLFQLSSLVKIRTALWLSP